MKALFPILILLTLALAYAAGRWQPLGDAVDAGEIATLESFRSAFDQGSTLERSYRFHGFLQHMGPDTVDEAAAVLESRSPWLVQDELPNFMVAWAGFDPRGAFDWGLSRSGAFREQAAGAALGGWAFHDPTAAREALEAVDPASAPPTLEEHLIAGWLSGGRRQGVEEYIASRPSGLSRQRYTSLLTIEIMRDSPDAVMRWAEAVRDDAEDGYKRTAFQKAANIVAAVDPTRAAEWVEAHLDQPYAEGAPGVVAQRWIDLSPPAALAWLAGLPPDARGRSLATAMVSWLNIAPRDAEEWLASAAPAPGLDEAVDLMLSRSDEDFGAAIEWAQRLNDPAERYRKVIRFGRTWLRRQPALARAWIEQSSLEPRVVATLLESVRAPASDTPGTRLPSRADGPEPSPAS